MVKFMYKVEMQGNYNLLIPELDFEFTPQKRIGYFEEEAFDNSIGKKFVGTILSVSKASGVENVKPQNNVSADVSVKEVPVKEEEEKVVNATDSSKHNSESGIKNEKSLVEERFGSEQRELVGKINADGDIIVANNKNMADITDDIVVAGNSEKEDVDEVKIEPEPVAEPQLANPTVKQEESAEPNTEIKPAPKKGRGKKSAKK